MKLKKYIEHLQKLYVKEGDLETIYSSDDEGNNYKRTWSAPGIMYVEDLSQYSLEAICDQDFEDHPDEFSEYTKVIIIN